MGRTRNDAHNAATAEAIKKTARRLMAEEGTNGLSVRGITKALDMTPPAIYHYFASLDDLTTALIVDSFNALADALELAAQRSLAPTAGGQLHDVLMTYRQWAVDHPIDFQLIYGNPIPGYEAPSDVTVPAVVRTFAVTVKLIDDALRTGEIVPAKPYDRIPPVVETRLREIIAGGNYPVSTKSMYFAMILWTQIHGMIYLEIFNHIQSNVGDVGVFYETQVHNMLIAMGLKTIS